MGSLEKSPKWRRREAEKRRREEKRWAAKSGPAISYIDPSRIEAKPSSDGTA